jgi:valyl-tRNA synthetase
MSKSEGNVIDPVDLIDGIDIDSLVKKRVTGLRRPETAPKVEKATRKRYPDGFKPYGADALRFTLAAMAAAGRDIKLSVERVEGYRNFGTKLWNAAKFTQMNDCKSVPGFDPATCQLSVNQWVISELVKASRDVTQNIEKYRFNDAAEAIYKFAWGTYCDWYVELIKPILKGDDAARKNETRACAAWIMDQILKLLHPFMPFITEELWAKTSQARDTMLILSDWPTFGDDLIDAKSQSELNSVTQMISAIRSVRAEVKDLPKGKKAPIVLIGASPETLGRMKTYADAFETMARVESWSSADKAPKGAITTVIEEAVVALPLDGLIDLEAEQARLEKEISNIKAEIEKIDKKLSNPNFVERAPEAVVAEQHTRRKTFADELAKIEDALSNLG